MDCKTKLNRKETGLNIYKLLDQSGFTYLDVAAFLELESARVIYDWCSGKKMPSLENLFNLAKLFNVQMEDILAI
ncbi:MAG: helix-turn-helix domain-containing protein [Candidatus Coproplasma sp.]